ncbi:unnamed protein product [Sphagnum jensenii]|uniref:Uncharacterized protein n=1 Tax=Sphagnum jensenii TaxID=128206 RepID=A0ABP1AQJ0_9BRYO
MFLLPLKELRIRSRWQGNLDDMLELQNKMHWLMKHAKLLGYEVEGFVLLELGSRLMGLGRVHRPCERPRQASGMFGQVFMRRSVTAAALCVGQSPSFYWQFVASFQGLWRLFRMPSKQEVEGCGTTAPT